MKEKTDYNFSPKEIQMLNLVDDFLNDDTNGILRLMEDGRKQYNNALKQYILSTEEYLSMLIDYFKFEIKKAMQLSIFSKSKSNLALWYAYNI